MFWCYCKPEISFTVNNLSVCQTRWALQLSARVTAHMHIEFTATPRTNFTIIQSQKNISIRSTISLGLAFVITLKQEKIKTGISGMYIESHSIRYCTLAVWVGACMGIWDKAKFWTFQAIFGSQKEDKSGKKKTHGHPMSPFLDGLQICFWAEFTCRAAAKQGRQFWDLHNILCLHKGGKLKEASYFYINHTEGPRLQAVSHMPAIKVLDSPAVYCLCCGYIESGMQLRGVDIAAARHVGCSYVACVLQLHGVCVAGT